MEEFVRSLPAAASSPYALAAYAIAALLFLFAGAKLRMAKLLIAQMTSIPEGERRRALEIATGTVLPTHVSPEQWIRHSRLRWTFLLLGSLLIVLLAIATIAILNPTTAALGDIKKTTHDTAKETQLIVQKGNSALAQKIDDSTKQVVDAVDDLKDNLPQEHSQETDKPLSIKMTKNGKPHTPQSLSGAH